MIHRSTGIPSLMICDHSECGVDVFNGSKSTLLDVRLTSTTLPGVVLPWASSESKRYTCFSMCVSCSYVYYIRAIILYFDIHLLGV